MGQKLNYIKNGTNNFYLSYYIKQIDMLQTHAKIENVVFCFGSIGERISCALSNNTKPGMLVIQLEQTSSIAMGGVNNVNILFGQVWYCQIFHWIQEEPKNKGAWSFIQPRINNILSYCNIKRHITYMGETMCVWMWIYQ